MHANHNIIQHCHFGKQSYILKGTGKAMGRDFIRPPTSDICSQHAYFALCRTIHTGNAVKQRRFSCAIGTNNANDLALLHMHRYILQSIQTAESLCYVLCTQYLTHARHLLSSLFSMLNAVQCI